MVLHARKKDGFYNQRLLVVPESVQAQIREHPLVQSLYLTDIGYFPEAKYHYRERPTGCASTIVICCAGGEGWVQTDHTRTLVKPGSVAIIPAGIPHWYGADQQCPWSIYWLHIQGEHREAFLGDTTNYMELEVDDLNRWITLFEECWEQMARGWTVPAMVCATQTVRHLLAILYNQGIKSTISTKQNLYINKANTYMRERIDRPISLNELAEYISVSKPHLITLFNRITGYPPLDYFLRMKIQMACTNLDFTNLTIKEIAMKLGFQDPYYFSRQFRKVMGQSPMQYRETKKG